MNFVFVSPHFPKSYWNFCDRLRRNGVNVLGIGDAPYDEIPNELKACLTEEKCRKLLALAGTAEGSFSGSLHRDGTLYFAVENNKGLFKGSGSDDVLREKFTRQLKWCTDVMDAFAP